MRGADWLGEMLAANEADVAQVCRKGVQGKRQVGEEHRKETSKTKQDR